MKNRLEHQQEVLDFLHKQFMHCSWDISLPHGWGNESYFANGNGRSYFIKLNALLANYQAMASIGLTPPVLGSGYLEDGTSILVQPLINGRNPTWKDYRTYLEQIAVCIYTMHHSPELRRVLPACESENYSLLARQELVAVNKRWKQYEKLVPGVAGLVNESLPSLDEQVSFLVGEGAVASHNDICNANWLITSDGQIYLIDLDMMSMDDPASDIGATLWWYYPPELREHFLKIVDQPNDEQFHRRMRIRMAIHCLGITLPRENSFDQFDPINYPEALTDFLAVLSGKENPRGYNDEL